MNRKKLINQEPKVKHIYPSDPEYAWIVRLFVDMMLNERRN